MESLEVVLCRRSAPFSLRSEAVLVWPPSSAQWRPVCPARSLASTAPPCLRRAEIAPLCPPFAAYISPVAPPLSRAFANWGRTERMEQSELVWPRAAEQWRAVKPSESVWSPRFGCSVSRSRTVAVLPAPADQCRAVLPLLSTQPGFASPCTSSCLARSSPFSSEAA